MAAYGCNNCNGLLIARGEITDTDQHDVAFARLESLPDENVEWFPRYLRAPDFSDVPSQIASAASEAYQCLSIGANRAALAISRAVVESTAKEKGITSGRLQQKIETMRERDIIVPSTAEAAHEIRLWGNETAHGDFVDAFSNDEAAAVLGLMVEVLKDVYQRPAAIERTKAVRQSRRTS